MSSARASAAVAPGDGAFLTVTTRPALVIKKSSIRVPSRSTAWALTPDRALVRSEAVVPGSEDASCEAIERESGDSALGFLGGMAGLKQEILFTQLRVDNLRMVKGTVRFTLTGPQGCSLLSHFGGGEPALEPDCALSIDGELYSELRAGEIDPQEAFMSGKIELTGDLQMAMQLALAVMSPD